MARLARERSDPLHHRQAALLIRLHGKAQSLPPCKRRISPHARKELERQFETLGLLRIDRHADAALLRGAGEIDDRGRKLGQHAFALRIFVARMKRRELDRNRWLRENGCCAFSNAVADRRDRACIRGEIARCVGRRDRGFAEHVERIAIARVGALPASRQRFVDRASHHELLGHHLHRLAHGEPHDRFAGARDDSLVPRFGIARGVDVEARQAARQHQSPRRRVDEQRIRCAEVPLPIAARELVANQQIGRLAVRNPQQRFGDAHQKHAFLRRQIVLMEKRLDARIRRAAAPYRFDP